jgi:glycosyltransferase involved in cell wall biosynthesis
LLAIADLRTRRPGIKAAIVGAGPLEQELRAKARAIGVADCVEFLGFRADVEEVYAEARVFVLTSESEGLPISMLEAMSTGVPPVVSSVGEIGSFLIDDAVGRTFSVGDVSALSEHLDALLDDESLRAATGEAGARMVRDRVSVGAIAETYRDLFSTRATSSLA